MYRRAYHGSESRIRAAKTKKRGAPRAVAEPERIEPPGSWLAARSRRAARRSATDAVQGGSSGGGGFWGGSDAGS
jgi:hypothetical protein